MIATDRDLFYDDDHILEYYSKYHHHYQNTRIIANHSIYFYGQHHHHYLRYTPKGRRSRGSLLFGVRDSSH